MSAILNFLPKKNGASAAPSTPVEAAVPPENETPQMVPLDDSLPPISFQTTNTHYSAQIQMKTIKEGWNQFCQAYNETVKESGEKYEKVKDEIKHRIEEYNKPQAKPVTEPVIVAAQTPAPVAAPAPASETVEPEIFTLSFEGFPLAQIIPADPAGTLTFLQKVLKEDAVADEFCTETIKKLDEMLAPPFWAHQTEKDKAKELEPVKKFLVACYPFVKQNMAMFQLLNILKASLGHEKHINLKSKVDECLALYESKYLKPAQQEENINEYQFVEAEMSALENKFTKKKKGVSVKETLISFVKHFKESGGEINLQVEKDVRLQWNAGDGQLCTLVLPFDKFSHHLEAIQKEIIQQKVASAMEKMNQRDRALKSFDQDLQLQNQLCPGLPKLTLEEYVHWHVAFLMMDTDFFKWKQVEDFLDVKVVNLLEAMKAQGVEEEAVVDLIDSAICHYANTPGNEAPYIVTKEQKHVLRKALYARGSVRATNNQDEVLAGKYSAKVGKLQKIDMGTFEEVPTVSPKESLEQFMDLSSVKIDKYKKLARKGLIKRNIAPEYQHDARLQSRTLDILEALMHSRLLTGMESARQELFCIKLYAAFDAEHGSHTVDDLNNLVFSIDEFLKNQPETKTLSVPSHKKSKVTPKKNPEIAPQPNKVLHATASPAASSASSSSAFSLTTNESNVLSKALFDDQIPSLSEIETAEAQKKKELVGKANKRWEKFKGYYDEVLRLNPSFNDFSEDGNSASLLYQNMPPNVSGHHTELALKDKLEYGEFKRYGDIKRKLKRDVYLPLARNEANEEWNKLKAAKVKADAFIVQVQDHALTVSSDATANIKTVQDFIETQSETPEALTCEKKSKKTIETFVSDCRKHVSALQQACEKLKQQITDLGQAKLRARVKVISDFKREMSTVEEEIKKINLMLNGVAFAKTFLPEQYDNVPQYEEAWVGDLEKQNEYKAFCSQKREELHKLAESLRVFLKTHNADLKKVSEGVVFDFNIADAAKKALAEQYSKIFATHYSKKFQIENYYKNASWWQKFFWFYFDTSDVKQWKLERDAAASNMSIFMMMVKMDEKMSFEHAKSVDIVEEGLLALDTLEANLATLDQKIKDLYFWQWGKKAFYENVRHKLQEHIQQLQFIDKVEALQKLNAEDKKVEFITENKLREHDLLSKTPSVFEVLKNAFSSLKFMLESLVTGCETKEKLKKAWEKQLGGVKTKDELKEAWELQQLDGQDASRSLPKTPTKPTFNDNKNNIGGSSKVSGDALYTLRYSSTLGKQTTSIPSSPPPSPSFR